MEFTIREAVASDAKAIHDIYGYYVENTFVTFTEINPSVEEYEKSILKTKERYQHILVQQGEGPLYCRTKYTTNQA